MNHCGTCKYFGPEIITTGHLHDDDNDKPTGYHACEFIKHGNGSAHDYDEPPLGSVLAYVEDGSGYHAALIVTTDFGCVTWEAKQGDADEMRDE